MSNRKIIPALTLIICATVAILYWRLIYIPVQSEIARLNSEAQRIEMLEAEVKEFQRRYRNYEEMPELAAEKLRVAQELIPASLDDEKFIAALYDLAANKKILITEVQVGEISENDSVQSQSIRIRLDADYISLLNFIREILDGGRLAKLESYTINGGESNILECELEFIIFATLAEN